MSEYLTLRLSDRPGKRLPWVVWSTQSQQVIASGELASISELESLREYAEQRTVIGLLDSSDVLFTSLETPKVNARQLATMLPFLIEDEVAQDPEQLHITQLHRSGTQVQLAVVEKSLIQFWVDTLESAGIQLKRLVPDVTALGATKQDGAPVLLSLGSQWLMHHSQWLGNVVDDAHLHIALTSEALAQPESESEAEVLPVIVHLQQDQTWQSDDIEWRAAEPELPIVVLTKGALKSSVNLLAGLYKKPSSVGKYAKIWRGCAVAAVALLAVVSFESWWSVKQIEAQATAYQQAREAIVRQVLPDRRNFPTVSYLKRLMNEEVARLSGTGGEETVLDWLARLPEGLEARPDVDISAVKFDEGREELTLNVTGPDFQTFEALREAFANQYAVSLGSLSREGSDNKVSGQFVLKVKP